MNHTILDDTENPLDSFKPKFWWKYWVLISADSIAAIFLGIFAVIIFLLETNVILPTDIQVIEESILGQFCSFFGRVIFGITHRNSFPTGMLFLGGSGYILQHLFYLILSIQTKRALQKIPEHKTWLAMAKKNRLAFWGLFFSNIIIIVTLSLIIVLAAPNRGLESLLKVLMITGWILVNIQFYIGISFFRKLHKNLF